MNQNYIIPSNYQNETFIPDRDKQQPMSPCALPSHPPLPSQYYPQISAPKQQLIHNNVNSRQVLNQNMQFSHNDLNNSSNNSQLHYTELFKIEISGIEIVVRQKLLPRLNLEMQQQRDEQPPLNLTNRTERSHQNRMHPYNMPGNEQNYRIINRNPNIILRQQNQQHYYSMRQQKNNVSEVDRTTVNESTNNINIQNTLVNQSAVFTRQRTDSFEECNHPLNQEL
ncbi:hypothetical protein GLOIN_2v1867344 [Rhizophagus clarus]|uniref:Uncharacterized protein n=1 Tax=Rhizophagus clarus TaxID=94130 RepID=A0A8H3QBX0_9GLOM|nr:hypothetical protein GLOIN_2v1867344 [Rhizophagus clarus]